jgi:hypothetical protein
VNAAYDPTGWHDFYLCAGGAAAALAGLLFVAMSIRLNAILRQPRPRGRATANLTTLLFLLVVALVLLMPAQPNGLLGAELALVGGAMLVYTLVLEHRTVHRVGFMLTGGRVMGNVGYALVFVAGLSVAAGRLGGLLWLPAAVLLLFAFAFLSAWRLMLGLAEEDFEAPAT